MAETELQATCLLLCDENLQLVRQACRELPAQLRAAASASPAEILEAFDYVLAPLSKILAGESLQPGLCEDALAALAVLLEMTQVDGLPPSRAGQVFTHVMERLLAILEKKALSSRAEAAVAALRCSELLLSRWRGACNSTSSGELLTMQLGYLTHMAVQLFASGHRDVCLQSAEVVRLIAEAEGDLNTLACFYPGVAGAFVRLLLHGDEKMGSKLTARLLVSWTVWLQRLLADCNNPVPKPTKLTLATLLQDFLPREGQKQQGLSPVPPKARAATAARPERGQRLPQVVRDSAWLAETGLRTSEALVAVLQSPRSPLAAAWAEKATVRRSAAALCLVVLKECRLSLLAAGESGQKAVKVCFEVLVGALLDEQEENQDAAAHFLDDCLLGFAADYELWQQLMEHFLAVIEAIIPAPSLRMDSHAGLRQRLGRARAFVFMLKRLKTQNLAATAKLSPEVAEKVVLFMLRLCLLDPEPLKQTLEDERPLVTLPSRSTTKAESFVELFPYEVGEMAEDRKPLSELPSLSSPTSAGDPQGFVSQVRTWLRCCSKLADNNDSIAKEIEALVGDVLTVVPPELAFSAVFEDQECAWAMHYQPADFEGPFPLAQARECSESAIEKKELSRRTAALYACAIWLDSTSSTASMEDDGLPQWIPLRCLNIILSLPLRNAHAKAAHILLNVCSTCTLRASLQALHVAQQSRWGWDVHCQVKHLLMPLLERLGAPSFATSSAAMSALQLLESILSKEGRCQQVPDRPLQGLLSNYSDYIIGQVCFQLKYAPASSSAAGALGPRLGSVMVAVVQHVDLSMVAFLRDVVHSVLHASPTAGGSLELWDPNPGWVLRVLASAARQMAMLICNDRLGQLAKLGAASRKLAGQTAEDAEAPLPFTQWLLGKQAWMPNKRRDGFILDDLGVLIDEDAEVDDSEEGGSSTRAQKRPSRYGREREIAGSIALWARNHLQAGAGNVRHLAHVAIMHSLTILSTRVRELLPCVHDVWGSFTPSFAAEASLAVRADACILLKHCARLSGDFVRGRFLHDCWHGLWGPLKEQAAVLQSDAVAWSPRLKAQAAALDVLSFLCGDPALVASVGEQLVALGFKFIAAGVAERLRNSAWPMLKSLLRANADLVWLHLEALVSETEGGRGQKPQSPARVQLAELGGGLPADSDLQVLKDLLEEEDLRGCPRVSLSASGGLWQSAFEHGSEQL